ncbi:MAG: phosphatase [Synergistaceae bacterium]|nr:phosphatase [Synergistaceae bacterium]
MAGVWTNLVSYTFDFPSAVTYNVSVKEGRSVELKLIVDTHMHTIASGHAFSTILEMVAAAAEKGLEMIAITEHGPAMEGAPVPMYFSALSLLPEKIYGVRVLRGIEANIIDYDGNVDMPNKALERLDFVMAGFHDVVLPPCGNVAANTRAMIAALANPMIDAISHPGNPVFQVDIESVTAAAKEYGKLLEINNNSPNVRAGSQRNCHSIAAACRDLKIPVICGSDAHFSFDAGVFTNALKILESVDFPEKLVLNTSPKKLTRHLESIRKRSFTKKKKR